MQTLGLSDSTPKPTPRFKDLFNPDLSSLPGTQSACWSASWACFGIAGVTALVAAFTDPMSLLDAALFALIGLGLRRFSRAAAVAGLVLYLIEAVYAVTAQGRFPGVLTILIVVILFNGVRASFAYQRTRREERLAATEPPPLPDEPTEPGPA